jgi:hypothetical protein
VDELIAHADHPTPRDLWVPSTGLGRDSTRGLANCLDEMGDGEAKILVRVELGA